MEQELIELLKKHREYVKISNQFSEVKKYYKENYYPIKKGYFYEEMIAFLEKGKLIYQSKKEPTEILQQEYELIKEVTAFLKEKTMDKNFSLQREKYARKKMQLEKKNDQEGMKELETHYLNTVSYETELSSYLDKFQKEFTFDLKNMQSDWNTFKKNRVYKYEVWKQIFLIHLEEVKEIYETYRKMNQSRETLQEEKSNVEKRIKELEEQPHIHRFYIKNCYPDLHGRLIVRECLICGKEEIEAEIGKDLPPVKTYSKKDRAHLLEQALKDEKLLKLAQKKQR